MIYEKHIFICTNQRPDDAPRQSCGEDQMKLVKRFQELIKENKLRTKVRAQRAGCFDLCEHGPMVAVYPDGIFYKGVTLEDVDTIVTEHIVGGKPVESLILKSKKG